VVKWPQIPLTVTGKVFLTATGAVVKVQTAWCKRRCVLYIRCVRFFLSMSARFSPFAGIGGKMADEIGGRFDLSS